MATQLHLYRNLYSLDTSFQFYKSCYRLSCSSTISNPVPQSNFHLVPIFTFNYRFMFSTMHGIDDAVNYVSRIIFVFLKYVPHESGDIT